MFKSKTFSLTILVLSVLLVIIFTSGCESDDYSYHYQEPSEALADIDPVELIEFVEGEGMQVNETADEAIEDFGTDEIIEALEQEGYLIYGDTSEALEDIDDQDLIDEVEARGYSVSNY